MLGIQEILFKHLKKFFTVNHQTLQQVAQGGCAVCILGDEPIGQSPERPALADPALSSETR